MGCARSRYLPSSSGMVLRALHTLRRRLHSGSGAIVASIYFSLSPGFACRIRFSKRIVGPIRCESITLTSSCGVYRASHRRIMPQWLFLPYSRRRASGCPRHGLRRKRERAGRKSSWQEIVLDLFFLTSRAPLHNASFWTLGVEMRWYLLCPLLIALFVRSRAAFTILLLALWTSYTLTPWSISDLGMLPCFMLGIVAAHVALGPPRYRRITFVVASCTVGIALYQSLNGEIDHGNPLWHLACFLIVVCARDGALRGILSWPPLVAVGRDRLRSISCTNHF